MNSERNPADLDPTLRTKWERGAALFKKRHPSLSQPFLSQCHRREVTQTAFFAQGRKPLAEVNALLSERQWLLRAGTLVDATILAAPSSTKNQQGARDPEPERR